MTSDQHRFLHEKQTYFLLILTFPIHSIVHEFLLPKQDMFELNCMYKCLYVQEPWYRNSWICVQVSQLPRLRSCWGKVQLGF